LDPGSLGRVVRGAGGALLEIVEARDADPATLALAEFNTGVYAFDARRLPPALARLPRDNAKGEEYLTDAVNRLAASGDVALLAAADPAALLGVNTMEDLARATAALGRRVLAEHMAHGVAVVSPEHTVIEVDVEIAPGARILPFTYVQRGCRIGPGAVVGPFARLRGGATLETEAEVGNFVEVKASRLGAGAKAKHLAYLGDATVGPEANIGCGTITANYDGRTKHRTVIGARARIGSGTVLVAPVEVGERAVTGAGAVVPARHDVAPGTTVVGVPARPLKDRKQGGEGGA
jgi:bifunctional UDP-N-acetylglucosamine pyrophosphorylase/glucosamine-1-phosphate N-acetyltransferase